MKTSSIIRIALFAALVAAVTVAVVYRERFDAAALENWVQGAGVAAPLAFMAVYALATVLFLPGSVMTLAGGALFGPLWGTFYNLTGATVGATLAFLVARYLASEWVTKKTGGRLKGLKEGIEREGWQFVAFVRLVPLFPFNLLNYALGLTRIKLSHYVLATYVFMLPGALAYTYLGYTGREAAVGSAGLIQKGLLALALLAVAAFLPRFVARLRKGSSLSVTELQQRLDNGEGIHVVDVRASEEFHGPTGHVPGSKNIPLKELNARLGELKDYKEQDLAVICRTAKRTAQAIVQLRKAGFTKLWLVRGGMMQWNKLGLPVKQ